MLSTIQLFRFVSISRQQDMTAESHFSYETIYHIQGLK